MLYLIVSNLTILLILPLQRHSKNPPATPHREPCSNRHFLPCPLVQAQNPQDGIIYLTPRSLPRNARSLLVV